MTAHKHAALMLEYAKDARESETPWDRWEMCIITGGKFSWVPPSKHPEWRTELEYRRKPRTIQINGVEIPEPVREPLLIGERYYIANIFHEDMSHQAMGWAGYQSDRKNLKRGLIFRTKEDAIAASKAIIAALGGEV